LGGFTSTPTATFQPTPAFINTLTANGPNGIAYSTSLIYLAEGDGASVSQVQVLNAGTNAVVYNWTGSGSTLFQFPNGVAVNSAGTTAYVLDVNNTTGDGIVYALAPAATPTPITAWTSYSGTTLSAPGGIALDGSGNVYIADTGNNLLEEFGPTGTTKASWNGATEPLAVAVNSAGTTVYTADIYHNLWVLSSTGSALTTVTSWKLPSTDPDYTYYGLALDSSSPPNVYVADYYNSQVEVYTSAGSLLGEFNGNETGATPLAGPDGLLLYNSNIYVADYDSNTGSSLAGIIEIFGPNNY
jgi:DNA-binding beta-propeller fold protein YncE